MGPWRLRSPKKICSGQVGDSGEPVVWCLSRSTGLRTRKPDAHVNSSPSLRLKMEESFKKSQAEKANSLLVNLFIPILGWIGLGLSTLVRVICFYSVCQFWFQPHKKQPCRLRMICNLISEHIIVQSGWKITLIITLFLGMK